MLMSPPLVLHAPILVANLIIPLHYTVIYLVTLSGPLPGDEFVVCVFGRWSGQMIEASRQSRWLSGVLLPKLVSAVTERG